MTACLLANCPTSLSPVFEIATTEGVVLEPSAFSNILASPPSIIDIAELVVPKSIPKIFVIVFL